MTTDPFDVARAITAGEWDADLDMIVKVAKHRMLTINPVPAVGMRGVLQGCRPLYLNGAPLTIVGKNQKRLVVQLDDDWIAAHPKAKQRWSGKVTCLPLNIALTP